jgi:K+-transporting ATPase KdpF subunit
MFAFAKRLNPMFDLLLSAVLSLGLLGYLLFALLKPERF